MPDNNDEKNSFIESPNNFDTILAEFVIVIKNAFEEFVLSTKRFKRMITEFTLPSKSKHRICPFWCSICNKKN